MFRRLHSLSRSAPVAALTLIFVALLTLGACSSTDSSEGSSGSDSSENGAGQSAEDQLAAVSDSAGSTEDASSDEATDEDLDDSDRRATVDEPPPPASVPSDLEGSLACAKVEAALIAAEAGDVAAINTELAAARAQVDQAGPELGDAGPSLIPESADVEDWQEDAYDFLDVCASTGYEPFVNRPEAAQSDG